MSLFDIFKKKTDEEIIADLLGSSPAPAAAATPPQLPVGTVGGNLTWSSSGAFTSSQLQQMSGIVLLSKEEKAEMENLRKEHTQNIKAARMNVFKVLNCEVRQMVINAYMWKECLETMNRTTVAKNQRLDELERKDSMGGILINPNGSITISSASFANFPWMSFGLPEDISLEELKRAHMEATLEEQVLKDETNS